MNPDAARVLLLERLVALHDGSAHVADMYAKATIEQLLEGIADAEDAHAARRERLASDWAEASFEVVEDGSRPSRPS